MQMDELQQEVVNRYTQNIEFLEKYHPDVFKKIKLLEEAINTGQYQEKYALEYKDESFDVMELASGNFLYNDNSIKISDEFASRINFKKNSQIFDGFAMFQGYEKHQDEFDDKLKGLEGIYPLMSYYLEYIHPDSEMQHIEKFIFIGLGLGLHLLPIDQKIRAEEYLLIEDDLELFRLSLFTTPYYQLGTKITFSINENRIDFIEKFKQFLSYSFFRNKYLKYFYFNAHSDEKIKFIKNVLSSQVFSSFPYKTLLEKFTRHLPFMKEGYKFINFANQFQDSSLSDKPCLLVAAGPSFSNHIEWLRKNHQYFTIIAVSSVLNKLSQQGISPDIITHLDGFDVSIEHFKGFDTKEFVKNSILIAGSFTPKEVIETFPKENVYLMEEQTYYHNGYDAFTGPCVGSTSVFQAILLNIKNIYTLGLDLAISAEGKSHADSHTLTKTVYDTATLDQTSNSISFRGDFFKVKGNFDKEVYTNPLFASSLHSLSTIVEKIKNNTQKIYNLSEGAYIVGTLPKKVSQIDTASFKSLDKKQLHKEIVTTLQPYSVDSLSQEDVYSLEQRVKFAQELKDIIQKSSVLNSSVTKEEYLHGLISLILELLQEPTRENQNLLLVYDHFISYAIPIIFDFFNTQQLNDIPLHIKKIHELLFSELMKIEKIYEERIKSFLEE